MNKDTEVILEDMAKLAADAPPPTATAMGQTAAQANKRLAASLDRVRGEAVQRAKAANARLRKGALVATATSFAMGALFGFFLSSKRGKFRF